MKNNGWKDGIYETYRRAADLINAENFKEGVTVCGKTLSDEYFISLSENPKNIKMNLVWNARTGNGLDNKIVEILTIGAGASDKVIMNRFNKLVAMI